MFEELQNKIIRKHGFEAPITIHFCKTIEELTEVIEDKKVLNEAVNELFQLCWNYTEE